MRQQTDTNVRQVLLPSGRTIEIVYLDGRATAITARARPAQQTTRCTPSWRATS